MAEAILRHKVQAVGLSDRIEIDSAGTGNWHAGESPHHGTHRILTEKGISTAGIYARQITRADLEAYDYILTMDDSNLTNVRALGPARAVGQPFLEYAPQLGKTEVPDPYYTGDFAGVYEMLDAACDGFLATIREEHGLS